MNELIHLTHSDLKVTTHFVPYQIREESPAQYGTTTEEHLREAVAHFQKRVSEVEFSD